MGLATRRAALQTARPRSSASINDQGHRRPPHERSETDRLHGPPYRPAGGQEGPARPVQTQGRRPRSRLRKLAAKRAAEKEALRQQHELAKAEARRERAEREAARLAAEAEAQEAVEAEKRAARKERKALTKEEQKAARDARYAARKARTR